MKISVMLKACLIMTNRRIEQGSSKGVIVDTEDGKVKCSYVELKNALESVISWADKRLDSKNIQKVTLCEHCTCWEKKSHMCKALNKRTSSDFYCKEGTLYHG